MITLRTRIVVVGDLLYLTPRWYSESNGVNRQVYPLSSREAPVLSLNGRRGDRLPWQTCPSCTGAFPKQIPPRRMCHRCDRKKQRELIIDRVLPRKFCDSLCGQVSEFFGYEERRAARRWYQLCVLMGPMIASQSGFWKLAQPFVVDWNERKHQSNFSIISSNVFDRILSYLWGEDPKVEPQVFDIIIVHSQTHGCAMRLCVRLWI